MSKSKFLVVLLCVLVSSCASVKSKVESSKPYSDQINWPEEYRPEKAKFFVHNEITIYASPQTVWNILIKAEEWPEFYEGAQQVKIKDSETKLLERNTIFSWKTMGLNFESEIKEFEPYSRLSWESRKKSIKGYHAWLILPTQYGCKLITDESQYGFLTFFQKIFVPNKLEKLHQTWLEQIKVKAEAKKKI